jgi:hypothetical protein
MTETTIAAPAAPEPAPAAPPRKPRLIRWWGLIILLALVVLFLVVLPFLVNPWVTGKVRNQLAARGWELTPESQIGFSLYGGRLHGDKLVLRMVKPGADGKQAEVGRIDRFNAEIALGESLTKSDFIIQELAAEGVTGSFRRGPDGRIATVEPDEKSSGSGIDWKKVDWSGWYQKGMERFKQWQEDQRKAKQAEEEAKKDPTKKPEPVPESARPAPESDIDWPKATRIQPLPKGDRHIPRVVIRKLSVSGGAVQLPDETPFEVASFSLTGSNVAARQDIGETMVLKAKAVTQGAGDITLDLTRNADDTGELKLSAPAVPVAALAHPAIAGAQLAKYGATGNANLTIDNTWKGWDLTGTILAEVSGLTMKPTVNDQQTQQTALAINALKGKPIAWPVTLGGTLYAPTVTNSGLEAVLKGSAMDAAKSIAEDKAKAEAQKLIDKQAEKNPEVKKASDALKGLFGK